MASSCISRPRTCFSRSRACTDPWWRASCLRWWLMSSSLCSCKDKLLRSCSATLEVPQIPFSHSALRRRWFPVLGHVGVHCFELLVLRRHLPPVFMRQCAVAFGRISCCVPSGDCGRAVRTMTSGHYFVVPSLAVLLLRNAWLDSGYMFLVSSRWLLDEFPIFSSRRGARILRSIHVLLSDVFFRLAAWRSVHGRCSDCLFDRHLVAVSGLLGKSFCRVAGSPGVSTLR